MLVERLFVVGRAQCERFVHAIRVVAGNAVFRGDAFRIFRVFCRFGCDGIASIVIHHREIDRFDRRGHIGFARLDVRVFRSSVVQCFGFVVFHVFLAHAFTSVRSVDSTVSSGSSAFFASADSFESSERPANS